MIARNFAGEKRVVFADLSHALDLTDPNLTFDGMHLNPPGNRTIADALAPYVEAVATK
jgi:lysophospholipase L1-like esterase